MGRCARSARTTRETEVRVSVGVDGIGRRAVDTGIGFLDHMLEQVALHARFDLEVAARGDLQVDYHHTVEDVGFVFGCALSEALGAREGVQRYGAALVPMDEALSEVVVDLSNRPCVVWRVAVPSGGAGGLEAELFAEWFHAFARGLGATLHVTGRCGDNAHHVVESIFKALGRALRQAVTVDQQMVGAPSTKGSL